MPSGMAGLRRLAGTQPLAVCPCSRDLEGENLNAPAQRPLQWGPRRLHSCSMSGRQKGSPVPEWTAPCPPPESTLRATLDNSVCFKRPVLAGCSSMEWQGIDRTWQQSCAGLGACSWTMWARPLALRLRHRGLVRGCRPARASQGGFRPQMMGMLRVKPIATPEVKFLDRCKRSSSEGVLQVHVRRSRMRVWGAKMIRHRRSPRL